MTDSTDEFRFLASDAARVGRTSSLPTVRRVRAEVDEGRSISGLAFRPETSPGLVALHGAGLNAHSFDPMLLALDSADRPVPALSLDLPGHGRSDWRDDADYRPGRLAGDIALAIERLADAPVVLLGHSLGGLTAALVAAARPELVRALIVVDITPGVTQRGGAGAVAEFITGQRDYGSVEEIIDRAIRFGIGSDRTALMRGITLNTRRRPDGRLEWTHHLAHLAGLPGSAPEAQDAEAAPAAPQSGTDVWAALRSLEIPLVQVRASAGLVDDEAAAEWRERLPGSDIVTLEGPHNLHEAVPRELAEVVRRSLP